MGAVGTSNPIMNTNMETGNQSTPYTNLSAEVQSALTELNADNSKYEPQNASQLLRLENSVQIFFVTSDGKVSTFSAPDTLHLHLPPSGWVDPPSHTRGISLPGGGKWCAH